MTVASVGSAVQAACRKAREDALGRAGGSSNLADAICHATGKRVREFHE